MARKFSTPISAPALMTLCRGLIKHSFRKPRIPVRIGKGEADGLLDGDSSTGALILAPVGLEVEHV